MNQITTKPDWLGKPAADRRYYIAQSMHVSHPDFVRAMTAIKRAADACQVERKGYGILAMAPTGSGKTYLSRFLKNAWPDEHTTWTSKIPVLQINLPSRMNKTAFAQAFLGALLGPKFPLRGNSDQLLDQVIDLIPKAGTRVVVIDNVHDIPVRRREGGIKEIGDLIRDLIDKTKCLFVLLGAPSAIQIVGVNPQLKRRVFTQVRIDYFQIDSPKSFARYRKFIDRLDTALPLAELCNFSDQTIIEIHWATFGVMDNIQHLFLFAVDLAVQRGSEKIEQQDLAEAFSMWVVDGLSSNLNPFLEGGAKRPLDRPGEPYHDWQDTWRVPVRKK